MNDTEKRVSYAGQPVGATKAEARAAWATNIENAKAFELVNARSIVDNALQAGEVADEDLPTALDFQKRSAEALAAKNQAAEVSAHQFRSNATPKAPAYVGSVGDSAAGITRRFSLSRAVTNVMNGRVQDGAEGELINEGRSQFAGASGQIVVPDWAANELRNVYGTSATPSGIDATVTGLQTLAPGGLRQALHGQPLAQQLGAQVIDGIGGQSIVLPWLGRTDAATADEGGTVTSSADFQSVSLTPQRYSRKVTVSALSLRTTPAQMDAVIMRDMNNAILTAQDKQAFAAVQASAGWVAGTAGTTADDLAATDMEDLHNLVSGFMDVTGRNEYPTFVVSRLGAKALNTGLSGTDTTLSERYKMQTGADIIPAVNLVDGNITSANAVGGSGTIAGAGIVLAGDFQSLVICRWSGIDLLVNPYNSEHNIEMHANAYSAAGVLNNAFKQLAVSPVEIAAS
jgi:hypothetical protein